MGKAKLNSTAKALQAHMASQKDFDDQTFLEWEMACNTNGSRPYKRGPRKGYTPKVWDQSEINAKYARDDYSCDHGATKTCHLECHNGQDFKYIVVKRHQTDGYIDEHAYDPDSPLTGNQLVDEINCWQEWVNKPESDFLCPILKFFTSKSDKVSAISETMQENVVIIAQRAEKVGTTERMCRYAAMLNGESMASADERYQAMKHFARNVMGWRDALCNGGNSGVIYDYSTGTYKAVFIDYAL